MPALLERTDAAARVRERAIDLLGLMTTPLLPADYLNDVVRETKQALGAALSTRVATRPQIPARPAVT